MPPATLPETVACVAYPAATLKKNTNFQAGAFSVNLPEGAKTEAECFTVPEPPFHEGPSHFQMLHVVKFSITKTDGVGAGNFADGVVYRQFQNNECYELDIRIAYSQIANYEPGTVKEFDLKEIQGSLKEVLDSFKFLK
jgi:hypothetical protein